MAKSDKNTKADTKANAKAKDTEEKVAEREFKFGVDDIAEALDIKPASVRVQLRNKGIEKAGKSYGWNSKADLKEVIDQLKAAKADDDKPAKKSKAKVEDDEDEAPKAKKSKKAPAKKAKKSKAKPADDEDDDD
jgi:hypothetical protein